MALKFLSDVHATGGTKDSSGDLGSNGQVLSSTGSDTNWVNPTVGTTVIYKDSFTAADGQTVFTLANTVDSEDKTQVYIDGAYQSKGGYTVSGTTLTFDTGLAEYSEVEVMTFSTATANNAASAVKLDTFTGDGSELEFPLSEAVVDEKVTQVYINGVYQNKSTYSIDSDLVTLRFGTGNAPPNSSAIEVISFKTITSTDGTLTATTFFGDLNGTINTATTATTQSAGNNSTLVATTEFATTALNLKSNIASPTFTGTVGGITKAMVGLSNVDNTTDANKPVSTAGQAALDLKANIAGPTFTGDTGAANLTLSGYLRGPASFVIDPAAHGNDTGTLVVAGNLQVDGTTTTINSTTVSIDDLNFSIATDAADSAAANGAGITIGGAGASLTYSHSGTKFVLNKPLDVTGAGTFSGLVTGQAGIYQSNASSSVASNKFETYNAGATNMNFNYPASGSVTFENGSPRLTISSGGTAAFSSSANFGGKISVNTGNAVLSNFGSTSIGVTNTNYTGISLGYSETASYTKTAIVQEQIGDGAARGHLHFLVDTSNDGNNATLADSKMNIHGTTGDVSITGGNVGINSTAYLSFNGTDPQHSIGYNSGIDGVRVRGQNGIILATGASATPSLTISSGGAATFASTISLAEMATIIVSDISTGENRGLKLENTGGGGKTWNITPGLTGSDNATFTIRNATDNVNALTIASGGDVIMSKSEGWRFISSGLNETYISNQSAWNAGNYNSLFFSGRYRSSANDATALGAVRVLKEVTVDNDGSYGGEMSFWTRVNGGSMTKRLTIKSGGTVVVGAAVDSAALSSFVSGFNGVGAKVSNNDYFNFTGLNASDSRTFYVLGTGAIHSTSTSITQITSDVNLKTEITDYTKGLSEVLLMKPRYYKYKSNLEELKVGFIAQEMEEALSGSMIDSSEINKTTGEKYKTYQLEWYPLLVKAIQEQQTIIEDLKARIETLEG
jgi:hypothetical protein